MFFDEDGGEEMTFDYTKDSDAVVKFGNAVRAVSTLFTFLRLESGFILETSVRTILLRVSN